MSRSIELADVPPTSIDWDETMTLARRGNGTAITTCLDRLRELEEFLAKAREDDSEPVEDEEPPQSLMYRIGWGIAAFAFVVLVVLLAAAVAMGFTAFVYGIVARLVEWAKSA